MRQIKKGATSQSVYVEVLDSTSTTGGRKTGLAFNTASLTAYYARNQGSATAITLATLAAANSAWSSGGFKEVDATNMPGVYRMDVPDASVAAGAGDDVTFTLKGATGMAQVSLGVQLLAWDPQDAVRGGLTALPNAAANAAGGLPISIAGALDLDEMNADIEAIEAKTTNLPAAPASTTNITAGTVTTVSGNVNGNVGGSVASVTGLTASDVGAIKAKTDSLTFTQAGQVDANIQYVNDVAVNGVGSAGNPWGP